MTEDKKGPGRPKKAPEAPQAEPVAPAPVAEVAAPVKRNLTRERIAVKRPEAAEKMVK
jgi:hypothetical protein